jgi:hypothetical protein
MPRPTLLVAESEPLQALSTRKLVLETAKFNVLTAHSSKEGEEINELSPSLAALIVVTDLQGAGKLVEAVKHSKPNLPVIVLSPSGLAELKGADYHLSSHEPERLVELCRKLFGDPRTLEHSGGNC